MKERRIISGYDCGVVERHLNEKYADWEIIKAFHEWHSGEMVLIMEREIETE